MTRELLRLRDLQFQAFEECREHAVGEPPNKVSLICDGGLFAYLAVTSGAAVSGIAHVKQVPERHPEGLGDLIAWHKRFQCLAKMEHKRK